MANMASYCKAYLLDDLSRYQNWSSKAKLDAAETGNADEPRYLFLQETYVVTDGIFMDEKVVFDDVTLEWRQFCDEQLGFKVPEAAYTEATVAS